MIAPWRRMLALCIVGAAMGLDTAADGAAPAPGAGASNVVPLTVRTPLSGFNRMVVSITLCEPGTDRCATIDDIMVDTGSTGLRLERSALPPRLRLPAFTGLGAEPLAECLHFVHDDAWGPLYRTDLTIGGLTARNLPIQVIADDGMPQPAECPVSTATSTSNGTLGIGPHRFDCQGACVQDAHRPAVFVQRGAGWQPVSGPVPPGSRVPNPATAFGRHGNGVVIDLPSGPADGADQVVGTLSFGVGTSADNHVLAADIVRLDAAGSFTTRYAGAEFPDSYIDSGTETYIFSDDGLPRCVGMDWAFCVSPPRTLEAAMVGADGRRTLVPFTVGDYRAARQRGVGAWDGFAEVAAPLSKAFVWGAPFFLGRRVALVFDGMTTSDTDAATGPFYALQHR